MKPIVYDNSEGGIDLELDLENGMAITLFLDDDSAREMITLIDNKLVARDK